LDPPPLLLDVAFFQAKTQSHSLPEAATMGEGEPGARSAGAGEGGKRKRFTGGKLQHGSHKRKDMGRGELGRGQFE